MSSVRKTATGKYELSVRHKLLPKPLYFTYADEAEARAYGHQIDQLLAAGVVPANLAADRPHQGEKLGFMLRAWINSGKPAATDLPLLEILARELNKVRLDQVTYKWAESWVDDMKLQHTYAPGTIRKRIGALSRCIDDYLRKHPDALVGNPLKLLPRGAASYNSHDTARLAKLDKAPKQDVTRERRLLPRQGDVAGEYDRIMAVLNGFKRPDRERALQLKEGIAFRMLFLLILHTGLRLMEAYMLTVSQVDLAGKNLRVRASKQWHGRVKYRDVPLQRELHAELVNYLGDTAWPAGALLFPWWDGDGDPASMKKVTAKLSSQFTRVFEYAQCADLKEHDLRHEATCRWYEMRRPDGQWTFREAEIDMIMGWAPGSAMSKRYASFRADDLAARLWEVPAAPEAHAPHVHGQARQA